VQLNRLEGMSKIGMAIDIILQDASLPHNFRSDGIKPVATDAEDRLSMGESSVGSFLTHGRVPTDTGNTPQNADAHSPKGQTRMHARHSMHFASL
jgi:hypothetical protein